MCSRCRGTQLHNLLHLVDPRRCRVDPALFLVAATLNPVGSNLLWTQPAYTCSIQQQSVLDFGISEHRWRFRGTESAPQMTTHDNRWQQMATCRDNVYNTVHSTDPLEFRELLELGLKKE